MLIGQKSLQCIWVLRERDFTSVLFRTVSVCVQNACMYSVCVWSRTGALL